MKNGLTLKCDRSKSINKFDGMKMFRINCEK